MSETRYPLCLPHGLPLPCQQCAETFKLKTLTVRDYPTAPAIRHGSDDEVMANTLAQIKAGKFAFRVSAEHYKWMVDQIARAEKLCADAQDKWEHALNALAIERAHRAAHEGKPGRPEVFCSDCPPKDYPTDITRCVGCPHRYGV